MSKQAIELTLVNYCTIELLQYVIPNNNMH